MNESKESFLAALRKPTAFIPVAMSVTALSVVLGSVAISGIDHKATDEGTAAHLWQLLMAGQAPLIAAFAIRWLPRIRRSAVYVLALQTGAGLAALAPVYFLKL